ncbi:MAG: hypothetical protein KA196_09725 [Arenimonas sp.]|nr:hypothetical protein [Arenimonas sp.]
MKKLPLLAVLAALLCACRPAAPDPASSAPPPELPTVASGNLAPAPAGQVPRVFTCRGNEPAWALDIAAQGADLRTLDTESRFDGELKANQGGSFRFSGLAADITGLQVSALMAPGQCFDTMADGPALPFIAQVVLPDGTDASGCCRAEYGLDVAAAPRFDAATKAPEDWSRWLADLAPALARCTSDAGVDTVDVPVAWPMNHGKATVRLRDSSGARFDCLVDLGSQRIEDVSPVPASESQPGEGEPRWLPAREAPPVLGCGRVEQVLLGGDSVLGYLHYGADCR